MCGSLTASTSVRSASQLLSPPQDRAAGRPAYSTRTRTLDPVAIGRRATIRSSCRSGRRKVAGPVERCTAETGSRKSRSKERRRWVVRRV